MLGIGPDLPLFQLFAIQIDARGVPAMYVVPNAPKTAHFTFAKEYTVNHAAVLIHQLAIAWQLLALDKDIVEILRTVAAKLKN